MIRIDNGTKRRRKDRGALSVPCDSNQVCGDKATKPINVIVNFGVGQSYCVSSVTFRKCKKPGPKRRFTAWLQKFGSAACNHGLVCLGGGLVTTDQKMSVGYWTIWRSRRPHAVYLLVTNRMLNRSGTDHYINRGVIYVTCFVTVSRSLILVDINHGYQLLFHMLSFNLNIRVKMSHRSMNLNMPDTFTMHSAHPSIDDKMTFNPVQCECVISGVWRTKYG